MYEQHFGNQGNLRNRMKTTQIMALLNHFWPLEFQMHFLKLFSRLEIHSFCKISMTVCVFSSVVYVPHLTCILVFSHKYCTHETSPPCSKLQEMNISILHLLSSWWVGSRRIWSRRKRILSDNNATAWLHLAS